jgi:uncharacterized Zn finger protein (UPF0148 family)
MKKGGKLLSESCANCGGILIQYQEEIICFNCNLNAKIDKTTHSKPEEIISSIKEVSYKKIKEAAKELEKENDIGKQIQISEAILNYINLINKVSELHIEDKSKEKQ